METLTVTRNEGKSRFHNSETRKIRGHPFVETIKDYIEILQTQKPQTEGYNANSMVFTLNSALDIKDYVDIDILIEYIDELLNVLENTDVGIDFVHTIDRVIQFYRDQGLSQTRLYIAKVHFLELQKVESSEREQVLIGALSYAKTPTEKIQIFIELCSYYQATSQYQLCINTCQESQKFIDVHPELEHYRANIYMVLGIVHFYLFNYEQSELFLQKLEQNKERFENNAIYLRAQSTALHYLGRIFAAQGKFTQAMNAYVEATYIRQEHIEDVKATAFYHIRMGELLIAAGLSEQAKDHLIEAQRVFRYVKSESSTRIQVDLAFAELYIKQADHSKAEKVIRNSIKLAKIRGFPRGELLGLEKLFWLQFKRLRFYQAAFTLYQAIIITWKDGEMRRNGGWRLLWIYLRKVPAILFYVLRGISYNVMGTPNSKEVITTCICPIHKNESKNS